MLANVVNVVDAVSAQDNTDDCTLQDDRTCVKCEYINSICK